MAILGCKLGSPVVPSPPSILAMTANIVNPVFHQLLNNSLLTVQVPSSWKLAKVNPLFKKSVRFFPAVQLQTHLLLSAASRMLEQLTNNQFAEYLEQFRLLHPSQFGLRSHHRTETALLEVARSIRLAVDQGKRPP